jgi:hypothetical protein
MTPPCPIYHTLPLDRQHLAAFTERHYGGTLQAVRIRTLRGGLQATGVFRVQAELRSPTGRRRATQFVVKLAHGDARRELTVYRALQANAAEALAPRLLGVAHAGYRHHPHTEVAARDPPCGRELARRVRRRQERASVRFTRLPAPSPWGMMPSPPAATAACASATAPTWRDTGMPRRGASSTSGRGWVPDTRSALPRRSSRVEPQAHWLYTVVYCVFPLSTSVGA